MPCKLCKERGKTWSGDDPKCAFENGVFSQNNWNCATMNALRDKAKDIGLCWRDDMDAGSFGAVPFEYGYIVMTWYKERGTTGNALVMWDDEKERPLTEGLARLALGLHITCDECANNDNGRCKKRGHDINPEDNYACEDVI